MSFYMDWDMDVWATPMIQWSKTSAPNYNGLLLDNTIFYELALVVGPWSIRLEWYAIHKTD